MVESQFESSIHHVRMYITNKSDLSKYQVSTPYYLVSEVKQSNGGACSDYFDINYEGIEQFLDFWLIFLICYEIEEN